METKYLKINPADNVAVAIVNLPAGEKLSVDGIEVILNEDVPAGHKFALKNFAEGEDVIKYGYPIGHAKMAKKQGDWMNENNIKTNLAGLLEYTYNPVEVSLDIPKKDLTFKGYRRKNGDVGVRNEIWIIPTVGCVNGIINQLAEGLRRETEGEGVDAIVAFPHNYMRYKTVTKGDEDKVSSALAKLMEEDLTLKAVNDKENRQLLLYGIGDQQLEVVVSKLLNRYKVEIELSKPKFAFRETIRKKVEAQGKYKKQSGGHGQYGDVKMSFEPSGDLETPYIFEEQVFGGAVPRNYFPAVEKGIQECVLKGPLAAYPVVGIKAVLLDGSYHPVDSSELAFKMAATLAFKKAFMEANPVLLEPIASLKVTVPDKYTGDIMGDLNRRRGRVLGMESDHHGKQVIEADIPMSELFGYNTDLRSMTGGIGVYEYEFSRYEQAPGDVQKKEVEARAASLDSSES